MAQYAYQSIDISELGRLDQWLKSFKSKIPLPNWILLKNGKILLFFKYFTRKMLSDRHEILTEYTMDKNNRFDEKKILTFLLFCQSGQLYQFG